mmetsp:Transcript_861/g.1592  ORF Transcript_861/g.1592 Transcript_861/m.1592 type:complete len:369 (-) Transcript_861:693-1799(-)
MQVVIVRRLVFRVVVHDECYHRVRWERHDHLAIGVRFDVVGLDGGRERRILLAVPYDAKCLAVGSVAVSLVVGGCNEPGVRGLHAVPSRDGDLQRVEALCVVIDHDKPDLAALEDGAVCAHVLTFGGDGVGDGSLAHRTSEQAVGVQAWRGSAVSDAVRVVACHLAIGGLSATGGILARARAVGPREGHERREPRRADGRLAENLGVPEDVDELKECAAATGRLLDDVVLAKSKRWEGCGRGVRRVVILDALSDRRKFVDGAEQQFVSRLVVALILVKVLVDIEPICILYKALSLEAVLEEVRDDGAHDWVAVLADHSPGVRRATCGVHAQGAKQKVGVLGLHGSRDRDEGFGVESSVHGVVAVRRFP